MEVRVREALAVSMTGDKKEGEGVKKIGERKGAGCSPRRMRFASEANDAHASRVSGRKTEALCADHHHTRSPATTNTNEKDDEER